MIYGYYDFGYSYWKQKENKHKFGIHDLVVFLLFILIIIATGLIEGSV